MDKAGYILGIVIIIVSVSYSIKAVKKSVKSGGCSSCSCPNAKKKDKE